MTEAKLAWQRAANGVCEVLLVSGEPGIGKTRFVSELVADAQGMGAQAWAGECFARGSAPYAPVAQIVGEVFSRSAADAAPLPDDTFDDLVTSIPSLRVRFPDHAAAEDPDPQSAQLRLFESFFTFCEAMSSTRPLLLFIDDVHWADADTLLLLRNLVRRGRTLPLLIVLTSRESELESSPSLKEWLLELSRDRLAVHLRLSPLGREDTRDLLAGMFDQDVTDEFLEGIFTQTEGNPFFIEEVCMALVEAGQFSYGNGHWNYPSLSHILIPQTVRATIDARVRQLSDSAQDVLRMAAVLGGEFDFETLRRAAGLDEESLITSLEAALRAQLIREQQPGRRGEARYAFAHVLIPTTLRESIIAVRRQKMHLQAMHAVEEVHPDALEALAYHSTEGADDERARRYNRLAGDRALQTAPTDAARFFEEALDTWPQHDPRGRAEILARLGYCRWVHGDTLGAQKCFEDAHTVFAALDDRAQSSEMQRMIGRVYWEQADLVLALRHYHQALQILENGPETLELARAVSSLSQIYMLTPDYEQAIAWGQRALALAERLQSEEVAAHALNNIGSSYAQEGDFDRGIGFLRESLQRALRAGLQRDVCRAYYNLGVVQQRKGDYAAAHDTLEELCAYATKNYARHLANVAVLRLMWIEWERGRWTDAMTYRAQLQDFSTALYTTWAKRTLAMMALDLGKSAEGLRELEDSLPSAQRAMDLQTTVAHLGQLIRACSANGQEARAAKTARQVRELVSGAHGLGQETISPLLAVCHLAARTDLPELLGDARTCLGLLERVSRAYGTGEAVASLAEANGCIVLRTDPREASAHFRLAAQEWEKAGRPYDQARALSFLSVAFAAAGDKPAANAAAVQARQIFTSLADQLDPERREDFLQALAAHPLVEMVRQEVVAGSKSGSGRESDALTVREQEVLRLLATGLTNAQIADRLVVSPLTINAHLRSIFSKLNVKTRTAAARLAMEKGLT